MSILFARFCLLALGNDQIQVFIKWASCGEDKMCMSTAMRDNHNGLAQVHALGRT